MARPREFDEIEAMDSAVETFRTKGYEAASLIDLLQSMRLSKSSLYNSFGTKHELFLAAIDHYSIRASEKLADRLNNASSVKEGIRLALGVVVDSITENGDGRGCLLHNCAIEVLPQDEVAGQHISNGVKRMCDAYTDLIRRGQASGEVSATRDAEELGYFLTMNLLGLRSIGRVVKDRKLLESMVLCIIAAVCER